MNKIKKKINNRIRSHFKSIENNLYATFISLTTDYKKINPPELNKEFIENLWSNDSLFNRLLDLNKNDNADTEKVLAGKFRVFSKEINYKPNPDFWYTDFFSDFVYPLIPYSKLKLLNNKGNDPIVPWELSRLQFIPTLIQTHKKNGNLKIFNYFIDVVDDWIKLNPYLKGINWKCTMDVGIRGINLALGIFYFYNLLPEDKKQFYLKVLWAHAEFVLSNESFKKQKEQKHNHYLVSNISLIIIFQCFNGKVISSYLLETLKEIKKEILIQFHGDGINFEAANHYHQFALEAILFTEIFLSSNQNYNELSLFNDIKIKNRIQNALQFVFDYTTVNTSSPRFGDSSDGRIIFSKDYFKWKPEDHSFLFDISNILSLPLINNSNFINNLYENSGYAFYNNESYGISLNCSKISEKESGHNHLDKASFVIQIKKQPVFIDSGTFCYTSDFKKRNEYRSTRSHNTIMVDSKEQIYLQSTGAFNHLSKILCVAERIDKNIFRFVHDGYKRIDGLGNIERIIKCKDDCIEIEDTVYGESNHFIEMIFNLDPTIRFKQNQNYIECFNNEEYLCRLNFDKNLCVTLENSFYSLSYREEVKTNRIVLSQKVSLPVKFVTTISIK